MNLLKSKREFAKFVLLLLILSSTSAIASKPKSIAKMREGLGKSSNDLFELGAEIRSLEKKLGHKNEQYLTHLEKIKKLDDFISKIREKVNENHNQLSSEKKRVTSAFEELLLNELRPQSQEHLFKQKVLKEVLVTEMSTLQKFENKNKKLLIVLNNYENQLYEMKQNEKSVYGLIVSLENEKKNLSKTYLNKVAIKNELEQKLEIELARDKAYGVQKRKQLVKTKLPIQVTMPLNNYLTLKNSSKGITLSYEGVKPIYATANGKVAYLGVLAAYGNVIIIDHGNEYRSVILGDFISRVKKGSQLQKGDLLGYTNSDSGITKNLYYELRKENIAQNTYKILKANKVL